MSSVVGTFPTNANHQTVNLPANTSGRFLRLRPALQNPDVLNFTQIILIDSNNTVITTPTTVVKASSLFAWNGSPLAKPSRVVNTAGFTPGPGANWNSDGTIWHSNTSNSYEFLEIDLGSPKTIKSIEVYSRVAPYERMQGVRIEVDNTSVANDYTVLANTDYYGRYDISASSGGSPSAYSGLNITPEVAQAVANGMPNCTGFTITANGAVWFKAVPVGSAPNNSTGNGPSPGVTYYQKGASIQATASAAQASAAQASAAQASAAQASAAQASAAEASAAEASAALAANSGAQASSALAKTSAAQASAALMFDPTAYTTLTNSNKVTIPTGGGPYEFNDGFVALTEDVLQNMSLDDLIGYSNTVSTSAGLEYSTILANQAIQSQYELLIQLSQSTIDGLSYEIQLNNAEKFANAQREAYLQRESTMYYSTIEGTEEEVRKQEDIMYRTNSTIDGLTYESGTIDSTLAKQDRDFVSSAIVYSSLYYTFLGWDDLLKKQICTIKEISSMLEEDIRVEEAAYQNLLDSTATWVQKSGELSTLYDTGNSLQSTLTQQQIDEANAIANYTSTLYGISTLSTMYKAAVANRDYAVALSKKTSCIDRVVIRTTRYQEAKILYENSITQTGGKQKGGAIQGDPTLWAAFNMASTSMAASLVEKISAEQEASTLQTLAGIANTDLYDVTIANLQATVLSKMVLVNTLAGYKTSSLQSLAKFSSMYDSAVFDMSTYGGLLTMYSSFYESSMAGASTLTGLANEDDATIAAEQLAADQISWGMSSLVISYNEYTSSYNGYMLLSSIYSKQVKDALNDLSTISTFYTSTNDAISKMNSDLTKLTSTMIGNDTVIFAQSSIMNSELINLAIFDMQIKDSLNMQERAAYEYRETYCRMKRIDLQNSYEYQVLSAIRAASTTSGQLQAANPGVKITPTPVNLNTPSITGVYNSLTSINNFLTNFADIYKVYDDQNINIQNLSTSIGAEANTWSTLSKYDSDNFYSIIPNPALQSKVNAANIDLTNQQKTVAQVLQAYATKQSAIASAKTTFATGYSSFFTKSDIDAQEVTISSFMIDGYRQALQNMSSQGIVFSL